MAALRNRAAKPDVPVRGSSSGQRLRRCGGVRAACHALPQYRRDLFGRAQRIQRLKRPCCGRASSSRTFPSDKLERFACSAILSSLRRCVAVRERNGWPVAKGAGEINTDYIEGMDLDGTPNQNRKNAFDDLHVVYTFRDGVPVLLAKAECTTQPGARYTLRPINQDGAAIIALGYQECWETGLHRGNYPALVQTGGAGAGSIATARKPTPAMASQAGLVRHQPASRL